MYDIPVLLELHCLPCLSILVFSVPLSLPRRGGVEAGILFASARNRSIVT